ncbi:endonuclease domain-containing 1 protein-like, partial [Silurus meridionalis]
MKLLALVLLLSSFSSLTLMEVVDSFNNCSSFFVKNPKDQNTIIVPTVFTDARYKMICQRWKNNYRFATVYDTVRRIPVYSAYTFSKQVETTRNDNWKIEPQVNELCVSCNLLLFISLSKQLEEIAEYKNKTEMIPPDQNKIEKIQNQAVNSDYTNIGYTRGHVFPKKYAANQDQADSTFTLTNIAPQTKNSNTEWDKKVEKPMVGVIERICSLNKDQPAYIVTGVVPGKEWKFIRRGVKIIKHGISVPSHFWSAFCC